MALDNSETRKSPLAEADAALVEIRLAEPAHADSMAECLITCFPGVFTSRMGRRFASAFCKAYLTSPRGIAIVAVEPETDIVVGFVVGGDPQVRRQFLAGAKWRFPLRLVYRSIVDDVVRSAVLGEIKANLLPGHKGKLDKVRKVWLGEVQGEFALLQIIAVLKRVLGHRHG